MNTKLPTPEEMAQLARQVKAEHTGAIETLAERWADFINDSPTVMPWGRRAALKATFLAGGIFYTALVVSCGATTPDFWQQIFDSWIKGGELTIEH